MKGRGNEEESKDEVTLFIDLKKIRRYNNFVDAFYSSDVYIDFSGLLLSCRYYYPMTVINLGMLGKISETYDVRRIVEAHP